MAYGFEVRVYQPVTAGAVEVNSRGNITGIILSAGASRRMGSPKALLRYECETFLDRLIRLFSDVCAPVIVVLGNDSQAIRAGLEHPGNAVFTLNPDPDRGMLSSLQCGLRQVPDDSSAVLFTLVDHPNIAGSTLSALTGAFRLHHAPVIIPVHQGRKGHPVCISNRLISEFLGLPDTAQPKDVIRAHADHARYIEVEDPGVVSDIDDADAYAALLAAGL